MNETRVFCASTTVDSGFDFNRRYYKQPSKMKIRATPRRVTLEMSLNIFSNQL